MHIKTYVSVLLLLWLKVGFAQNGEFSIRNADDPDDLKAFYAETKQVNQFFRRFNAEENIMGVRFSANDSLYRNPKLRREYLSLLFDNQNDEISEWLKSAFINELTNPDNPKLLDFHSSDWFSETVVKFHRGNKEVYITLLMKLVNENLGYKWVIDDVRYNPYEDLYKPDEKSSSRFLHPLSHELDFMNLDKVFASNEHAGDYFKQNFEPSKLSIFLYELRNGYLEFEYVTDVKFHFFQIKGWYFEISEFNRPGTNRGWLISNLIKLEAGQKESLRNFLYNLD